MAFSFFGKKQPEPKPAPRPAASRPAEPPPRPPARPAEPPRPAAKPAEPQRPAARPAEPQAAIPDFEPRPAAPELPSLDFTGSSTFDATRSEIAANIEIVEASDTVHPAIEEAAVLFANGQYEQAAKAIEASLAREDLGSHAEQLWLMLFDTYQALGAREDYEARALDYAMKVGKSPPAWTGADGAEGGEGGSAVPMASLGALLDQAAAKQLEMAQRMLARNPTLRLDVGKVKDADEAGCSQLLQLLHSARKAKQEIIVQNAASLARIVQSKLEVGKPEKQPMWLLLLELLQHQGQQDPFEEQALNYAITFEVSPPSWETPRVKAKRPAAPPPAAPSKPADDVFELKGELVGGCAPVMEGLRALADTRDAILIDATQLKRIDFVCAGNLLNTLFSILQGGKTVRIRGVSAAVFALMSVIGISQAAQVERRRY